MLLGGAAGHVLGGIIGPRYGWQEALFIVAFAGIVPGIALFWIDDPPRGPRSEVVPIATASPCARLCCHDLRGNLHHVFQRVAAYLEYGLRGQL